MIYDELLNNILIIDSNLRSKNKNFSKTEQTYARAIKLNEEVGELMSMILSNYGDQRSEKLTDYNREKLDLEFADVIITTLLLAESMNVDINKSLIKKLNKIKDRGGI